LLDADNSFSAQPAFDMSEKPRLSASASEEEQAPLGLLDSNPITTGKRQRKYRIVVHSSHNRFTQPERFGRQVTTLSYDVKEKKALATNAVSTNMTSPSWHRDKPPSRVLVKFSKIVCEVSHIATTPLISHMYCTLGSAWVSQSWMPWTSSLLLILLSN
jgi:hypothetical protein